MTDVYVAYAREDRERVRPLAEMLQFEGWDVWWDPSEPATDNSAAIDQKLGSAGAILVVWSPYSRGSEYVRSEAATGLYKNKLIQVRIDAAAPPRPFDQVEVVDINHWSGERDDPNWRRIVGAIRLYAGEPGSTRPQVMRKSQSGPAYLEPGRTIAWGPLIAAGLLAVAGAAVWLVDPFKWRSGGHSGAMEVVATSEPAAKAGGAAMGGGVINTAFEDTNESDRAWATVKRSDPDALRAFIQAYPRASGAESARSMLRVLDAQAWVDAVTADNEAAYSSYLRDFPISGPIPGAMATDARDRLVSISVERTQAIEDIQRGLLTLKLYRGQVDGRGGDGTAGAVRQFALAHKRSYPTLSTAAPRDLRAFADAVRKAVDGDTGDAPPTPIIATATTTVAPPPTPSATAAAAEADRQRLAKAQAASKAASTQAAATQAAITAQKSPTDAIAEQEQKKLVEANAWAEADKAGTVASYQAYLASYPSGTQAAAARAAISKLNRPAAFSLDLLPADVKAAAEAARRAQSTASSRAAAAREAADAASSAPGRSNVTAANGDNYVAQIASGAPNGLGVKTIAKASNAGDRYRGELRNGQSSGLGVYEFADNPGNASAGAVRYEGEHSADKPAGYGVTYWKNGDTFSGQENASGQSRGILIFANGQRYEGEVRNGARNGYGVVWSSDGQLVMAGRWENGQLVEPVKPPQTPIVAAPLADARPPT